MVLPDHMIRALAEMGGAIKPYAANERRPGVISFGESSAGYDVRLGRHFKVFTNAHCGVVDPKNFDERNFIEVEGDTCLIPPNSFALGVSVEEFAIPEHCICLVLGKSTYTRCGIMANVTPLEPLWKGKITIEISNTTPLPARVYAGEGICQVLFLVLASKPECSYADKAGIYQGQDGVTLPRVRR